MKLYVIGLGPGDENLITVRGAEILKKVKIIFIPYSTGTNRSLAENIVRKYADKETRLVLLGFPMSRKVEDEELKKIGERICSEIKEDSAFVTLGDPTLYSTFFRAKDKLPCRVDIEVIPGVSSITACASKALISLANGEDSIAIIPASRLDQIEKAKEIFETLIILKTNENIKEIVNMLNKTHFLIYARRCFMDDEKLVKLNDETINDKDYFSMIIAIRKER
ncbi:cobalt-factor II C(20)-methyltransferase [Sulfolobus tengchongensis]|uniref:Cobalt-factor II C(20)-methyltransferase n=1 Tax=Sulfolobus tengchongensis TaxID=207809 RepID=A0AAX4L384_9CREN